MVRIRIIGLTLVATFAFLAVAAASASALEWLLNGKPITAAVAVNSKGTLLLSDLKATGGRVAIICEGTDKGTVGPGAKDEVTAITATGCVFENELHGICEKGKAVTATAINIGKGWSTLIETVGTQWRDHIIGNEAGKNPGWSVTCTVAGIIKVSDECTSSTAKPLLTNVTGGVLTTFEASETAECSKSEENPSGMVIGPSLNEDPNKTTDIITVSNSSAK